MAHIHFLKEGSGEGYAKRVHTLPIAQTIEKLSRFAVYFHETGPILNPDTPVSSVASYRCVVLEVEPGEENSTFPKAGYYTIGGLAPADCANMFGIYF